MSPMRGGSVSGSISTTIPARKRGRMLVPVIVTRARRVLCETNSTSSAVTVGDSFIKGPFDRTRGGMRCSQPQAIQRDFAEFFKRAGRALDAAIPAYHRSQEGGQSSIQGARIDCGCRRPTFDDEYRAKPAWWAAGPLAKKGPRPDRVVAALRQFTQAGIKCGR